MSYILQYNITGGVTYYAIIGDVKTSKTLKNRDTIQEKLENILNNINLIYKDAIVMKFLITIGDERYTLLDTNNKSK